MRPVPARVTGPAARFARDRCEAWDDVHRHYFPDYDERWARAIDTLRTAVSDHARILDLGCGPGTLTARLASSLAGPSVLGVDLDPLLIELARAAHPSGAVQFVTADILSSDASRALRASGSFDAVVSSAFMHYFDTEQLQVLHALIERLLTPGGILMTVERFAPSPPGSDTVGTDKGLNPWEEWWQDTREAAPRLGFTPIPVEDRAAEPPPLTQEEYVESLHMAGFSITAVETLPGGSTIVTATHRACRDSLR
ncbi:MAG: class I SAM-dependent methyltransferase [Microbacterium sp.]